MSQTMVPASPRSAGVATRGCLRTSGVVATVLVVTGCAAGARTPSSLGSRPASAPVVTQHNDRTTVVLIRNRSEGIVVASALFGSETVRLGLVGPMANRPVSVRVPSDVEAFRLQGHVLGTRIVLRTPLIKASSSHLVMWTVSSDGTARVVVDPGETIP